MLQFYNISFSSVLAVFGLIFAVAAVAHVGYVLRYLILIVRDKVKLT